MTGLGVKLGLLQTPVTSKTRLSLAAAQSEETSSQMSPCLDVPARMQPMHTLSAVEIDGFRIVIIFTTQELQE